VIARLLGEAPQVLASVGGAFMDPATSAAMKDSALTVWLKAPAGILLSRVKKRDTRPLLQSGDPLATIEALLAIREPVYAEADITLECADESHHSAVDRILAALRERGLET
jgi:shikimate kinase